MIIKLNSLNKISFIRILFLLKQLIGLVVLFMFCRLLFFLFNFNYFIPIKSILVIESFLYGFHFDFSVIVKINFIYIVLFLFASNSLFEKIWFRLILNVLFILSNSVFLTLSLIDIVYFSFVNKRISSEIWFYINTMKSELLYLFPHYLIQYWYLFFCFIVCICGLFKLSISNCFTFKIKTESPNDMINKIIPLGFILILCISARGINKEPLRSNIVTNFISIEFAALSLNTPFVIIENTFKKEDVLMCKSYIDSSIHFNKKFLSNKSVQKQNVVIIILESFSKEYSGLLNQNKGYTPFLDSLIRKGFVCTNAYANGRTTLEALPAILCSMPSLCETPIILSLDKYKQLHSLAENLNNENYSTSFFYGARNGNLGINTFIHKAGFKNYYGKNEFGDCKSQCAWGIPDDMFFNYFAKKIDSFKEPFFTCFLSLSSHSPFDISKEYSVKFVNSPTALLKSISYTDYCLSLFFKSISKAKWFNNTLFVLVADHVTYSNSFKYSTNAGMFSIPMLYYHPKDSLLKGCFSKITQQIDIKPSILNYLHYSKEFKAYGNSIFDSESKRFAVMKLFNQYQIIDSNAIITFDSKGDFLQAYKLINNNYMHDDLFKSRNNNIFDSEKRTLKTLLYNLNYNEK